MKLSDISLPAFIQEYGITTETGARYDMKSHLFLYDFLCDWSQIIVCKKAAQVGFSTAAILKSLWAVKNKGIDAIYTLPTDGDVNEFVSSKVNRMIQNNPALGEVIKDKDSVEQKRVGNNVIFYRGTWTERAALMVSSDLNIYDEEDRSKQETVQQYASRLQHSKRKWEWHFSNPSVGGTGVSRLWDQSDAKEWFVRCKNGHETELKWPDSIDRDYEIFVCSVCNEELSAEERRKGRWIKGRASGISGYHISLLQAPWVSAREIIGYANTKSPEYFQNFVLGEPYISSGATVTPDLFSRNFTDKVNNQEKVIIGCDSGIKKHYVCGNNQGLFYYGVTEDWEDIARLLNRFEASILVVDAMPDITGPRMLRERFPGRVFLNHYNKDRKTMQLIRWGEDKELGNVLSDRNRLIQLVIDEFSEKRIPLQGNMDDWGEFISHWRTLYRVDDVDMAGNPTFRWETSTGMDHWAHACCYWRIGMDRFKGGGKIVSPIDPLKAMEVQRPFNTSKIIQASKEMPVWWNRELD